MRIPCKQISEIIEHYLAKQVDLLLHQGKHPKLLDVLVGNAPEQASYVAIKERVAHKLHIGFHLAHFKRTPPFHDFLQFLEDSTGDPSITGAIVQLPLPTQYNPHIVWHTIPEEKEIEGHRPSSFFHFPLCLSILTGIKYVYNGNKLDESVIVHLPKDLPLFQRVLQRKKIVIAGRGPTGGKPIAKLFQRMQIDFIQTHSQTKDPERYYKQADIIITATGKKIITHDVIKPGVVLLNVGLREEEGNLKGDYNATEIHNIASYYTPTPGGLGPIDVLYLYYNLINATRTQNM
jgi:methylenetetrahydrofolate dehydrogenase (NADP+) / methenyltetrahydrofolate cyclohydrolase